MLPNTCGKQPLRILLVDRSEETRDLFASLFTGLGHEVRTVTTMGQALYCVSGFQPDAVFTAIFLADGSGFDLCAALRKLPRMADTLIVAITGHRAPDAAERAQEVGFDQYLVKPVKLDTLLEMLKSIKLPLSTSA